MLGKNNHFFGRKHTQKTKDAISNANTGNISAMRGRSLLDFMIIKHGEEEARKRWKAKGDKHSIKMSGKNNPFYGKTHTNETIKKIIDGNRKFNENMLPEERESRSKERKETQQRLQRKDPDYYRLCKQKAAYVSHKAQSRYKKNKIEQMFHNMMIEHSIDVKYSLIMNFYQYDFGNKVNKVLFEINGDYWHANPKFYGSKKGLRPLNETQKNKIKRDKEKLEWAKSKGFRVVYIWEYDLYNNPEKVLKEVKNVIKI
jgi:very-short-patch-repair endonuclease